VSAGAGDASLRSLARALGLSTATVSNAFNRPERVNRETLRRILEEADRVAYGGPDPAAHKLRRGRADAVGVVLTDELPFAFYDQAAVGFLAGLAQACEESGRSLLMLPSGSANAHALRTAAVDGVLVYSVADNDPLLDAARVRRLPIVVVDQPHAGSGWDWVGIDHVAAGRTAAEHLAHLGHGRVGILAPRLGPERRNGPWPELSAPVYAVLRDRIDGFRAVFAERGVTGIPIEERTTSAPAAGAAGFEAIMARHPGLTGIFCLSDELALGALERASALGIRVPEEVSIIGVDDIERAEPAGLTTVEQPLQAKGAVAGRLLIRRIDERLSGAPVRPPVVKLLPSTLHVRTTTAPAVDAERQGR